MSEPDSSNRSKADIKLRERYSDTALSVEARGSVAPGAHVQPLVEVHADGDAPNGSGVRVGRDTATLKRAVLDHLVYTCGRELGTADMWSVYEALAFSVRDRLLRDWVETRRLYRTTGVKRIYYLSAEFLLGRAITHNLINTGMYETARQVLAELGLDIADVIEQPSDPGLGNGGLGRLAACLLDSMATLGYAGYGYGIRYEFGAFEQRIDHGWQREHPDGWLRYGTPWEIQRHEFTAVVNFGGKVEQSVDDHGRPRFRWVDTRQVLGVPHDMLISGYQNGICNTLRLWSARASRQLDLGVFNDGDYRAAVEDKVLNEAISKVLYPNDQSQEGKRLRLIQQYFFVCCSIWDVIRRFKRYNTDFSSFPHSCVLHLNDTHPAIAVAELMRVLVDEERLDWDQAWDVTRRSLAYTNHTLLPEALERWPVALFEELLPRHLQIIYEINHRFMLEVHVLAPNDHERQRRMSIIEEGPDKQVRMAHLAVVGSSSVNGVAALHTELIKKQLLPDFYGMWPERFVNQTNGVTPRRWMLTANPKLSDLITRRLGNSWVTRLTELEGLSPLADDAEFRAEFEQIKRANKAELASLIARRTGVEASADSIFVVQVKRFHEYKRQLLNALHLVHLYLELKRHPGSDFVPQTFIFSGKAAPGYASAKLHIKLIHDIASIVNRDPTLQGRLRVAFLPNYSVSLAEVIMPAADLSVQISLAGTEASGTGNMKMALNGALTVGTYDGANIEIMERVGAEHFFMFGLRADEVSALRAAGYVPRETIERSERLRDALELIRSGFFNPDDIHRYAGLVADLEHHDYYMVCADFDAYLAIRNETAERYRQHELWTRSAIQNVAQSGVFSSDETVRGYARNVWGAGSARPLEGG